LKKNLEKEKGGLKLLECVRLDIADLTDINFNIDIDTE
jgi:hypothetical protein